MNVKAVSLEIEFTLLCIIYQFIYLIFLSCFYVKIIVNWATLYVLVIIRFCFSMASCKAVYITLIGLP